MPQLLGFARSPIRGPGALPLVGTPRRLLGFLDDPIGTVLALRARGEDVVAVVDRNPAIVCVFGAERIRDVLASSALFHNPEDFFQGPPGSARDKMRAMVVTSNGDAYRRRRRLLLPAFQRSALDGYAADIVSLVGQVLDRWPANGVVPLDQLCRELALCIAVKCLYGIDVKDGAPALGRAMAEFVRIITSPANILLPINVPGFPYHRGVRLGEELAAEMMALVDDKQRRGGSSRDAIGLLLAARDENGEALSRDELMALAVELFIAGSDTTAMTLLWVMFLLDQHPGVLDAVRTEIETVLGDRDPAPADLPRLELLDRVIKESMRVLPTAPVLFLRRAAEDTTLGGMPIPKHANVVVSPFAIHHDAKLYPNPERFDPDRWKTIDPAVYTYMPFGAGPRTCTGMLFASQALRLALPMILRRHRLRTLEGTRIDRLVRGNIFGPKRALRMRIEPANGPSPAPARVRGDIRELVTLDGAAHQS